jgi:hypothetical protein
MDPDLTPISDRVQALSERAGRSAPDPVLLDEIESTLCDGYAEALKGDAWSAQMERRMQELIALIPAAGAARELRVVAKRHGDFQVHLVLLRRRLVRLRGEFDRLGAAADVADVA